MKNYWIYIALAAIVFALLFLPRNKKSAATTTPALSPDDKSKKDIADAMAAVTNCNAMSILPAQGTSPYNGQVYNVGQPCHLDWLVANRGWKVVVTEFTPEQKTQQDIADAQAANANTTCIALAAYGRSPYNGNLYQMSVCDLNWLKENRAWADASISMRNRANNAITILPYNQ